MEGKFRPEVTISAVELRNRLQITSMRESLQKRKFDPLERREGELLA